MKASKNISFPVFKLFILLLSISLISCANQNKIKVEAIQTQSNDIQLNTNIATKIDNNIRSIFQDAKGNYWFGTNDVGVYRYDGKTVLQFTEKDGLANNQIQTIQEDNSGNIWFGTGLFGVSRYNGQNFTTFTNTINNSSAIDWKIEPNDLWFYAGAGTYRLSNETLTYLLLDRNNYHTNDTKNSPYKLSPNAVYTLLKDKKGNLWFGTQSQGVCKYDGTTFKWFTEKNLKGPAVLALFEDRKGNIWFGNNGGGLFQYNGKELINFSQEKGLENKDFTASGQSGENTLARIYAVNEDSSGNIWIGTVDAGVWRYDGKNLTQFTTKNGLTSNAVNCIYKDKKGELWFGTDQNGICKFNGESFYKFEIK